MKLAMPTEGEPATVVEADCREAVAALPADSFDSLVSDPPYGLSFMGKGWDHEVPGPEFWATFLRVVKPGGYIAAMGGARTFHRLTCAIEDAGYEVRDCLSWLYGTGFPKGQGCLKPGWEPIILARKPGPKVLPLGIEECRIAGEPWVRKDGENGAGFKTGKFCGSMGHGEPTQRNGTRAGAAGRWPANVVHDGSDEVMEGFAAAGERTSGKASADGHHRNQPTGFGTVGAGIYGGGEGLFTKAGPAGTLYGDSGSAARFFFCAKPSPEERGDNRHPTVKPLALMRWLVRLVCPADGLVLDPFGGSGTTAVACLLESRRCLLVERETKYADTARRRVREAMGTGLLALTGDQP